ncbi:cytochrome P450 [Pseudonocardia alaniniphila]|uniref:Cytochrome P450 n=1 Tax=Pseudonocardia alaniniphila TaxID=75291 RepID=A0ABS9TIU8_9PSEU|nr:cytochrome P450 [Pseudonocardia alaniniphila]MCH6168408.1 cytochrome P450 [Pseudonocardia alaniniphila]
MPTTTRTLPFERPGVLEPPPAYAELRRTEPVARVTTPDGTQAWLVTSYDAVATVLADPRFGVAPLGGGDPGNHTLFQDGDAHARLRRLVSTVFTPRHVESMRARIEELAADHVAAMAAAGPPADLVDALAAPLSITTIGELLGIPADDRAQLRRWADTVLTVDMSVPTGELDGAAMEQAWESLSGYAAELVATRRSDPGDDLMSALIGVHDAQDGRLSGDELTAMVTTLVSAGYLSACNVMSVAVIHLVGTGRLARLAGAPEQLDATVEEVLRHQSGVTGEVLPRWAHEDVELGETRIAAGDMVLARLEAANRDPDRFPDPDRFVPERPNPHLAFGRGPHHCLGAALARTEIRAALHALAVRLPGLRLRDRVEDIPWIHGFVDSGPAAVHVTW